MYIRILTFMAVSGCGDTSPDNEYIRMDFKSWDVTFALRSHSPAENRHARRLSAAEAKDEVFYSPRLQRIMREVCLPVILVLAVCENQLNMPHPLAFYYIIYHVLPAI